eukprot:5052801-Ditylum_brightwellii.AAC.1
MQMIPMDYSQNLLTTNFPPNDDRSPQEKLSNDKIMAVLLGTKDYKKPTSPGTLLHTIVK